MFPFPWRCQPFNVRRLVTVVQLPAAGTPLINGTFAEHWLSVSRHLALFLKTGYKESTICYCMSCDRQISLSILVVDSKKLANVHPSARVNSKYDFKQSTVYSAKSDLANTVAWQNYGSVKPSALLLLIKCPFIPHSNRICNRLYLSVCLCCKGHD